MRTNRDLPIACPDQPGKADLPCLDLRFCRLLDAAHWSALPPAVRTRFSKRLAGGQTTVYSGRVTACDISRAGMILAQAAMLFTRSEHAWMLWLLLAVCVPVTTLVQSHVALAFPPSLAGRANSAYNLLLFIGAFTTQWGFGVLVDGLKGNGFDAADAFRVSLAIAVALETAALVYFTVSRAQRLD